VRAYYDTRAPEYDDWWLAEGLHASAPTEWKKERDDLVDFIRTLRPKRTLVVADAALHGGSEREEWQERELNDGSRWEVYKRYFSPDSLLDELGGGETLFAGHWFVVVRSP